MVSTLGLDFPDTALEASVVDDLGRVEAMLREVGRPDDSLLTESSRHLMEAGGKRFRAMLVLLAAQFGNPADPRVVKAAVAIELTHLATLFHDDVMDEADVRRGSESVNSRWGNSVAILAGDFLFAQASLILASLGPDAVRIQAETFNRLVTGQLAETVGPRPGQDPLDHYMFVINEKTGSLIATAGLFGAMFSGASSAVASRIARACELMGVAWQLSDDVIDVASESNQSGKTPGTDLRQGVPTLPVLYALRSTDPADERLRWLLGGTMPPDGAAASGGAGGASSGGAHAAAEGGSPDATSGADLSSDDAAGVGASGGADLSSDGAAGVGASGGADLSSDGAAGGGASGGADLSSDGAAGGGASGGADLSSDDELVAEALRLLRAHEGMAEARADVLSWANSARTEIMALPDVPARAAFLAMCDFVVKRTG